jgi:hypothetical protein
MAALGGEDAMSPVILMQIRRAAELITGGRASSRRHA